MNPECSKVHNVPKGNQNSTIYKYYSLWKGLFKPISSSLNIVYLTFQNVFWSGGKSCFDNLILDLSNGHNLCYISSFFGKCDLILFITFYKKFNHLKKTKFGQGLIPQTVIQRFGMLKDFQLSKWEFNLGVKGLLPFYSHKVSWFMWECVWTFLHVNLVPCSTWFQLKGFQLFFVSRTFCCLT
jgi:hypothetical protein